MSEPVQEKLKQSLRAAEGLYHRLVLLVGESGSGKTQLLREFAGEIGSEGASGAALYLPQNAHRWRQNHCCQPCYRYCRQRVDAHGNAGCPLACALQYHQGADL